MTSLAHWCYRRRVAVLTGWIVVLVGLGLAALGMGTAFSDATAMPDSESATAYTLLAQVSGPTASAETGTIVWQPDGVPIDDPTVQADASAMLDQIAALPGVTAVVRRPRRTSTGP